MRSDEAANLADIERDRAFRGNVKKGVSAAATIAATAGPGSIASRIMPFINQYIPVDLAVKGISKVSPQIGAFLKKGQQMGLDLEGGLEFLRDRFGESDKEPPKEDRNIIQQYSPELHSFISDQIKKGRNPYQAGAIASKDKRFAEAIKKLTKDHGLPWADILTQIYGDTPVDRQGVMQKEDARFQTGYGDQLAQQQGQGLDPSVAAILQQGQAILQQFKGRM